SGRYRRGCPVPATAGRAGSYGHVFRRTVRMSPDRVKVDRVKTGMGAPRRRVDPLPPGAQSGLAPSRRRLWVSRSPGRAVVRYGDGRVLKGYADFDPARPSFRLVPPDDPDADGVEVAVADLKAVFFVRSFDGDSGYEESKDLYQPRPADTRKVSVRFRDGEE